MNEMAQSVERLSKLFAEIPMIPDSTRSSLGCKLSFYGLRQPKVRVFTCLHSLTHVVLHSYQFCTPNNRQTTNVATVCLKSQPGRKLHENSTAQAFSCAPQHINFYNEAQIMTNVVQYYQLQNIMQELSSC